MNENIINIDELKKLSQAQYESLNNLSLILNSSSQEESLIENVVDVLVEVTNAERGLFAKYNELTYEFSIVCARNIQKESIEELSKFSSGVLQQVVNTGKPIVYHDVQGNPKINQFESVQLQKIKSVLGVPIKKQEKIWGVILVDSQKNRKEFTDKNLLFLQFFSNLVSLSFEKIFELENLSTENLRLKNELESVEKIPEMIGESFKMKELSQTIHKVAKTDATVLISGESGVGKDLVAKAIHKLSSRSEKPFLAQFCGSIPDNLLESELFGFVKGAFTGAVKDKKGLFEVANEGTFFLDEIADISSALQAKLLRVLENKEIIRLGDTTVKKVDVRIVAATNKDLKTLVEQGQFREDLYYRLNVFPLKVPPLRKRRDDISLLVNHFIKLEPGDQINITPSALNMLEKYSWPGNVRQLSNVISRAIILSNNETITKDHISLEDEKNNIADKTLKELEEEILIERLDENDGNKTKTANSLGVSVRWIQKKMKEIQNKS